MFGSLGRDGPRKGGHIPAAHSSKGMCSYVGVISWIIACGQPLGFVDLATQVDCTALGSFYPHRSQSCSCGSQGAKLPMVSSPAPSAETWRNAVLNSSPPKHLLPKSSPWPDRLQDPTCLCYIPWNHEGFFMHLFHAHQSHPEPSQTQSHITQIYPYLNLSVIRLKSDLVTVKKYNYFPILIHHWSVHNRAALH